MSARSRFAIVAVTALSVTAAAAATTLDRQFDFDTLDAHPAGAAVRIDDVPVPGNAAPVDLVLERFDVLAPDATVVVGAGAAARMVPRPEVVLLRGTVAGDATSRVFIGVGRDAVHGFITGEHGLAILSTGRHGAGDGLRIASGDTLDLDGGAFCGNLDEPAWLAPLGAVEPGDGGGGDGGGAATGGAPCRVAPIAIETDWEFTSLFGGDVGASGAYALILLGAVNEIFVDDVNTRLHVNFLRLYDDPADPWAAGGLSSALVEFRDYWRDNEDDETRTIAHMLSGRGLGGGIAYLNVLCSTDWGYSVSGNLNGSFPYPVVDYNGGNWDLIVTAHELGHNFGTPHTHDYAPPIDGCGDGDCSAAFGGTIMSYCHLCAGGLSNIQLNFHPTVIGTILSTLDAACDMTASGVNAVADQVTVFQGAPTTIDVLLNDETASCDPVVLSSFPVNSSGGGTIELVPADGSFPRDRLRVTTAGAISETFVYEIEGDESAIVRLLVEPLRQPDVTGVTEPGAAAAYFTLTDPQVLPDFDALTPYATDITAQVNFATTGGVFATSGLADEVGAVFEGFVDAPADGLYTFYTESDDGSRLLVGDDLVVSNDGLHGMVERSGQIALAAGTHRVRVEFFERFGGAGLIVRWEGPGLGKQVVPAGAWSHGVSCVEDVDGSGLVDFTDLLAVLAAWGPCAACPEDIDGSGAVDFADLLALLAVWGAC